MVDAPQNNVNLQSPLVELKSGIYFLKVISAQDMRSIIRYRLEDCAGHKYTVASKIKCPVGKYLRCSVWVGVIGGQIKTDIAVCQKQFDPNNPPKPKLTNRNNSISQVADKKGSVKEEPKKTEPDYTPFALRNQTNLPERKAMEIFDKMKELGFHKCGKAFTCSCCGERYDKFQGIVSDVKEIYLCNSCRAGQKKRERTSNSLRTISIPMGNTR